VSVRASDGSYFKRAVKGNNFVTPVLKGFYRVGAFEVEWSEERYPYMGGVQHFGVTVVRVAPEVSRTELGACFDSEAASWKYIQSLEDLG
jgi:hypothetical protein